MKCIVLQTGEGKHLGFILFHFDKDATVGDCVFSIVPTDASLFQAEAIQPLFARRDLGESRFEVDADPPRLIRVQSRGLPDLLITLDENGVGRWGQEAADGVQEGGKALIPKRT
jgi:hypothetical protein